VQDQLKKFQEGQVELHKSIDGLMTDIGASVGDLIQRKVQERLGAVTTALRGNLAMVNRMVESQKQVQSLIQAESQQLTGLQSALGTSAESIGGAVTGIKKSLTQAVDAELNTMKYSVSDILETSKQLQTMMNDLAKKVMASRQ
jgi:cell fate (sporulation/competence/biofilm development) regulator YlbF (YheA/YmcA/DUF963 family)